MADCKRKTANLFDKTAEYTVGATTYNYTISGLDPNKYYTCSTNFERISGVDTASIYFNGGNSAINGVWSNTPRTFKPDSNGEIIVYIRYSASAGAPPIIDDIMEGTIWVMVNEGSTPLPYEPYGWVHSLRKYGTDTDILASLPVNIYADGNNATVSLKGNTVQSGTPTPDNPIMPEGTGERTAQLWDISSWDGVTATRGNVEEVENGFRITALSNDAYTNTYGSGNQQCSYKVLSGKTYTLSWEVDNPNIYGIVYVFSGETVVGNVLTNVVASQKKVSFTVPSGHNYIAFRLGVSSSGNSITYTNIMLNTGSTALPYEPYGYKIPISMGGTTNNVFLGEVQSTRRVKKQVVTISRIIENDNMKIAVVALDTSLASPRTALSTVVPYGNASTPETFYYINANNIGIVGAVGDTDEQITAKYEGSILYYGIAETTGIVNEPLMKIGDYADTVSSITVQMITGRDTFDVDTTLKPSEVSLSYTGWHDAAVQEWDGSQWNE